jgi:hypothetical protein
MTRVALFALVVLMTAAPAFAQVELAGYWNGLFHEDQLERVPGPSLGDYLGLPINDQARAFAEAWDASRLTVPEHQCRAHASPYIYRGPLLLRMWEERDPQTQDVVALRHRIRNFQQDRTIWMDGRAHPSAYAPHTWMGFSTGRWESNVLVVRTTHIKQMWHRRNGLPQSDKAVLTERYIRHGDTITLVTITDDPVYLAEPPGGAAGENHKPAAQCGAVHAGSAPLPMPGRGGDREPAARRRAALPAGPESVSRRLPQELQAAGGRHARRSRHHVSGVSAPALPVATFS